MRAAWCLILLSACAEDVRVTDATCEQPCYSGPAATSGLGSCRPGVPVCVGGKVAACGGEVLPALEVCDGTDNDCNGEVDDAVTDRYVGMRCNEDIVPFDSSFTSQCKYGVLSCVDAELTCVGLVRPSLETCDGIDNDCDGVIDEGQAALAVCYEGSAQDLASPLTECRAGVLSCVRGRPLCVGEVRPAVEVCDGLDNDCNGSVDDVAPGPGARVVDVVFLVDVSGSMAGVLITIRAALEALLRAYGSDLFRYALVYVPGEEDGQSALIFDLSPARSATTAISSMVALAVGVEPSYDAAVQCVDGTFPLSWRAGSIRILAFFGDEEAQTQLGYSEVEVAEILVDAGVVFHAFVLSTIDRVRAYDDIAGATGGQVHDLLAPPEQLYTTLEHTLQSGCAP